MPQESAINRTEVNLTAIERIKHPWILAQVSKDHPPTIQGYLPHDPRVLSRFLFLLRILTKFATYALTPR